MSLQYYLRLPLVCLVLSVVGCFSELPVGDLTENDPKIKKQVLENFISVNPATQNSIRSDLQRNLEQFNNQYQQLRINSSLYSQRNSVPQISSNVNSRNNPVELSSVKNNDGIDAKRSYAFQTVQREQNPLHFTANQKSSRGIDLAPWLIRKGQTNGKHAANEFRSEPFGYQHISNSKSEMYSDSLRPLGLNEPYLREAISAQPISRPAHAERIPINYMSGSSTVKHDTRGGNILFDNLLQNNGQNQKVVPLSTSLSIVRANPQASKSLPRAFSAGTEIISYENMRDVALSKVFKPPAVQTPITPVVKKSNSNRGQSILPLKKSLMFSSQHDQVKQSNFQRVVGPKANPQSSFDYGMSSYTLKDIQSIQNGYQNRGQSSHNSARIQMFHSQKKYDNLGTGMSAIRPSETNAARSYKGFSSDENTGIRRPMFVHSNQTKQGTHLTPPMQFPKGTLFSEHDAHFNLPDSTYHSLRKPSQHNAQNRTDLKSSGQSTVQSLDTKNNPVPGKTMRNVHRVSPSVSGMSSSQTRPYYLTSKKPFAFRGFIFVPTMQKSLQKTEMHSGQKPFINSSSNVQYAPPRSRNTLSAFAQKPLTPNSYEKKRFHIKDTSQEKQPDRDQTDSFDNESKSKTSQRWISSMFTSAQNTQAQTESNQREIPTVRSSYGSFVGPNRYSASMKSSNSHENPTSELVFPVYKASLMNKMTGYPQIGNAVIQPIQMYNYKEHEGLINLTKEKKTDRNSAGATQSNISENYNTTRSRPASRVEIGRPVEVAQEGEHSSKNIYAIPSSRSPIYRASDINSHKTNSSSIIYRPAKKHNSKSNILPSVWPNKTTPISKTDIDLSAVGVSQASSPTSSFVVGRYVNTFNKFSTKPNLNMSSTRTGLNNYKPVRFSDIAGSASFTKQRSADSKAKEEVDLGRVQNSSSSTPLMEESFKELLFDTTIGNSSMTPALQNETDESTVDLSGPDLITTAATDLTTESQLSFTEEYTLPQPTVYSTEPQLDPTTPTAEGIDPFYEGTLIPNTTLLVTITSE